MSEPSPLEAIFFAALERAPDKRAAYLNEACAGDTELRRRIERMLAAQADAASFLETPHSAPVAIASPTIDQPRVERPGTQIGPYKLLQQIGEGGMGVVYMAEQTHPVQRKVALKLIKSGMDSRQVIARFEAERQALAMMDHVNIARVLDAGTTEQGRPYFVMELVHGVPITKYCDDNRLTPRQRLELYVPVCQAIQHAHQKGIIHRDIKPSNVMVTLYDGKPVPKVIDFGVAKATEQKLTERTLFTQFGTMVGTLEYMSPEQAEMSALGADTRSDIYSLGVLLYELLTGNTPLTHMRMKEAAYGEILRLIKEEEPPKPSTRLTESGEALASISAQRHTEPAKLSKLMRGELDWIVMKTLEKDRNRRYETAKDFAADVQRYLNNETVQACPPSARYRLWKFVRRYKGPVLAASLVVLALVGGIIGTTFGLIRAEQQRLVVERQRNELSERNQALEAAHERERLLNERALQATETFTQAIETITSEAAIEQLTREKELRPEQEDFLDKMIQYYAESTKGGAATEQERARQARAYFRMGHMNQILGRFQDSENAYRRAVACGQKLAVDFPTRPEFRQELALSHNKLGVVIKATGRLTEAEAAYAAALAILKQLAAEFPNRPEFRQALAGIHNNLGNLLHITGRLKEAEAAHAEALAIRKQLAVQFPDRPDLRGALAMSDNNLGWLLQNTGRLKEAEPAYAEAVAIYKQLTAQFPDRPDFRLALAKSHHNLGNVFGDTERLKEAEASHAEALAIEKQLADDFPNRPEFRQELADGHSNLGWLLQTAGRLKEAEPAHAEAVAIYRQLAAQFPDRPDFRLALARSHLNLGNVFGDTERLTEAEASHAEALAIEKQLADDFPNRPEFRQELANAHNNLGNLLASNERLKDAEAAYGEALVLNKQLVAESPMASGYQNSVATTLFNLGKAARRRRDFGAARQRLDEAFPYHLAALQANPGHPDYRLFYRYSLVELTQSCAGQGDRTAALAAAMKLRDLGWDSAADAYGAAWTLAWCVPIVEKDDQLDAPKRQAEMQFYADQAMAMLRDAVAKGYKDIEHLKQNNDFDLLREREDFKQLISELQAKKK